MNFCFLILLRQTLGVFIRQLDKQNFERMQEKGLRAVHTNDRNIFEPQMEAGIEHFTCQDSCLSQIFKLIFSASGKTLNKRNVVL